MIIRKQKVLAQPGQTTIPALYKRLLITFIMNITYNADWCRLPLGGHNSKCRKVA